MTRAGRYVKQPTGYRAFIPTPLPPDQAILKRHRDGYDDRLTAIRLDTDCVSWTSCSRTR